VEDPREEIMPGTGNLNKIWDAVRGNYKTAWNLSRSTEGWKGARKIYQSAGLAGKTARDTRYAVGMASRAMSGAIIGATAGATWGAISDKETILGGAMKGAFVGGVAATSLRHFKPNLSGRFKPLRNISKTRLSNIGSMRDNLSSAWTFMSKKKNQGMRNWIVGMGLLGVARGMTSGDDNPVGGAAGGALAGGIQGAGIYGGYRGAKAMGLLKNLKFKI
jgi:hypothetical protein